MSTNSSFNNTDTNDTNNTNDTNDTNNNIGDTNNNNLSDKDTPLEIINSWDELDISQEFLSYICCIPRCLDF